MPWKTVVAITLTLLYKAKHFHTIITELEGSFCNSELKNNLFHPANRIETWVSGLPACTSTANEWFCMQALCNTEFCKKNNLEQIIMAGICIFALDHSGCLQINYSRGGKSTIQLIQNWVRVYFKICPSRHVGVVFVLLAVHLWPEQYCISSHYYWVIGKKC